MTIESARVERRDESHWQWVQEHPFEVYDPGGFVARFSNLLCAARTVDYLGPGFHVAKDNVMLADFSAAIFAVEQENFRQRQKGVAA